MASRRTIKHGNAELKYSTLDVHGVIFNYEEIVRIAKEEVKPFLSHFDLTTTQAKVKKTVDDAFTYLWSQHSTVDLRYFMYLVMAFRISMIDFNNLDADGYAKVYIKESYDPNHKPELLTFNNLRYILNTCQKQMYKYCFVGVTGIGYSSWPRLIAFTDADCYDPPKDQWFLDKKSLKK